MVALTCSYVLAMCSWLHPFMYDGIRRLQHSMSMLSRAVSVFGCVEFALQAVLKSACVM
jgi:hypothetical protein